MCASIKINQPIVRLRVNEHNTLLAKVVKYEPAGNLLYAYKVTS